MTLTDLLASNEFFRCFDDNIMKINPGKCHLLISINDNVAIRIGNFQIENTKREKLLRIQFDNKLSFDYHSSQICKRKQQKTLRSR